MKNMEELTQQASKVATDLIEGRIDIKTAAEFNNTCGKIINAQKTKLAARLLASQIPDLNMPYLECNDVGELAAAMPLKLRQG